MSKRPEARQNLARQLGIGFRSICVVAAALMPPLLLFAYSVYAQRTQIEMDAVQRLQSLGRGVADAHGEALRISRSHMALLGGHVWYLQTASEQCSRELGAALTALRRDVPEYANLALFDAGGQLACSAVPAAAPLSIADRPSFRRAVDTRTFTTTPYGISVITGDPVVGALQPIVGPEEQVVGVLLATLHVGRLSTAAANVSDIVPGLVVTVFDRRGTILARMPDGSSWVGRALPDAPLIQAASAVNDEAVLESRGLDGTRRLTAIKRLPNLDVDAFVAAGHDTAKLLAPANRFAAIGAAILMITALVAFGGAWYLGDRLVVRSVRKLADASRRVAAGDLGTRVEVGGGAEFQDLGKTFNALVSTLGQQQRDLEANLAALREERARVEHQAKELAQTSTRLQGVIDAAPFAIIVPDHDYVVRVWSRGAERIFGYTADEIVGRRYPLVPDGGWPEFERLFRRVAEGEVQSDVEVTRQAKDGRLVDIRFYGVPLRDPDGVIRSNLYTLIDITEEKRNRDKLNEATTELAALIQAAPVAIQVFDPEGRVQLWNPAAAELFGYTIEEAVGKYPPYLAPEDMPEFFASLQRLRNGERLEGQELRRRRRDGRILELRLSGAVVRDAEGAIRAYIGVIIDMTDRNLIERQFHRAQRLESVGQLTGGLAHDFNNLLGIIVGNLELLTDDIDVQNPLRPLVDAALEASLRGAELNKSLLAFSRQQQLEPRLVEVNGVVEGMTKLLRRTLGEHIEIELHTSPDLWPTLIDRAQLESAIVNLAVNARDAMPEGGRLTLETANKTLDESYVAQNPEARPGDYVMLAVTDSGTGMSTEVMARVFEPFFTTKEVGKGSGLGLSMVYGFVKQSNGHVKIYSEVKRGTTIRLYLPRAATEGTPSVVPAAETANAAGDATILVVEDNEGLRRVTVLELSRLGYRTLEADGAEAALAILGGEVQVDLLFSDVVMPGGMDGFALAREAVRRRPGLRVLLTSGFPERAAQRADKTAAPWRVLSKPYRRQDLARMLTETLGGPASRTESA